MEQEIKRKTKPKKEEVLKTRMPISTAKWLLDETALTFDQIAEFCNLDMLEVEGIANAEIASNMKLSNPIETGQLTQEEIQRCTANPEAKLQRIVMTEPKKKKARKKLI